MYMYIYIYISPTSIVLPFNFDYYYLRPGGLLIYLYKQCFCSFGKDIMVSEPIVSPTGNSTTLSHEQ